MNANLIEQKNAKVSYKKYNIMQIVAICGVIFAIFAILINPTKYIESARRGIFLWGNSVLPALFPFLFLTRILVFLLPQKMCRPAVYVFCLSVVSGYPVSAKLLSEYYERGEISSVYARRVFSYSSCCGPVFLIGTVGALFFKNTLVFALVFVVHIVSSLIVGLLLGGFKKEPFKPQILENKNTNFDMLSDSIFGAISSILLVGAYVMLFYVFFDVLCSSHIVGFLCFILKSLGVSQSVAFGVVSGFFEMTRGVFELGQIGGKLCICLAGAVCSFSGLCVILQSYTFLKKTGMSFAYILLVKFLQAVVCFFLLWFLL